MADSDLIISAIITGMFFLLFALLLYQSLSKDRRAFVLTISLFVGGVGGILSVLQYVTDTSRNYFLFYSMIVWSICYFLIYIFFEEMDTVKPNRIRLLIATTLLLTSIAFNQLYLYIPSIEGGETYFRVVELIWDTSYNALGLFIFIVGVYVHIKSYLSNKELIPLLQAISMSIIGIGFIVGYLGDVIREVDFNFYAIGDGIKIAGMIIFTLIYIVRIDFIYRLPVNVYSIMVFTKIGLNIHTSRVSNPTKTSEHSTRELVNENLLSSLIAAISSLLRESLGSEKALESIIAEDRTIVLDAGQGAICAILCDRPTFFLESSLKSLRKAVEERYKMELKKPVILKNDFEGIDQLIRKTFPFLMIGEELQLARVKNV